MRCIHSDWSTRSRLIVVLLPVIGLATEEVLVNDQSSPETLSVYVQDSRISR